MVIAIESLTSPGLQSAALTIAAESLASPGLQSVAYPVAITVDAASKRRATVAAVVASATIAGNAFEGAGTMLKQLALSSVLPSCHIVLHYHVKVTRNTGLS
jgi:hypothetical protein